jgi:hypothetical protein
MLLTLKVLSSFRYLLMLLIVACESADKDNFKGIFVFYLREMKDTRFVLFSLLVFLCTAHGYIRASGRIPFLIINF